jgi:hypothetical protein
VNGTIKLVAPLLAALAVAACNAGGNSNLPATAGQSSTQSQRSNLPEWQAKNLATAACPQVKGVPACMALIQSKSGISPDVAGWAPADFQARYHLPSSTNGAGQVVAIVDAYDNPNVASDLAAYRSQFGLGTAPFTKYNQNGQQSGYPRGSTGWGVEIDLDVEMVAAACPKCSIDLIEANSSASSNLQTAEVTAVNLGAHIVSNSWSCLGSDSCVSTSDFDTPGVVYLAASGDSGYNQIGAPAVFASVVAVGGTVLSKSGATYHETVWNGAGAGCSVLTKPSWQHDPSCAKRTVTDVSAVAWQVAEYDTYGYSGWFTVGGTSVATPLNAAVFGLAGNASTQSDPSGFWTATQPTRRADLNTISSGSDGSCSGKYLCTAGTHQYKTYSGPAGWGTPNGIGLY